MSDPTKEEDAKGQKNVMPTGSAAVTGSVAEVSLKQAGAQRESQSVVIAPETSTDTTAPDSSAGAEPATETGDEAKTEAPEAGGAASPPPEGTEQARAAPEGSEATGAAGDRAAPGQQQGQQGQQQLADPVPRLVQVVHSARSVFRQRDVREYDPFTAHLERRITKLFEALDTEQTGRVDVHELGTLIRSVGCCPSETELQEMVTQLEEEGQPGFIRLHTVMPYIIQCVEDRKYPSASTEQLLQAFQVLADDCAAQEEARAGPKREKKEEERDTLPQDKLVHILTEEGEHFSQEEVEEMLSVVPASDSARVQYTEFVKQLVVPELW